MSDALPGNVNFNHKKFTRGIEFVHDLCYEFQNRRCWLLCIFKLVFLGRNLFRRSSVSSLFLLFSYFRFFFFAYAFFASQCVVLDMCGRMCLLSGIGWPWFKRMLFLVCRFARTPFPSIGPVALE